MEESEAKCLVLIGDGYVGKTSIFNCLQKLEYNATSEATTHGEFVMTKQVNGQKFHVKIIDTAGQEEYEQLRTLSYQKANLFLLCFCIADETSFENVSTKWAPDVEMYSKSVPIVLVGTKSDYRRDKTMKCISHERCVKLGRKIGAVGYVECSALRNENVEVIVERALGVIYKKNGSNKSNCAIS